MAKGKKSVSAKKAVKKPIGEEEEAEEAEEELAEEEIEAEEELKAKPAKPKPKPKPKPEAAPPTEVEKPKPKPKPKPEAAPPAKVEKPAPKPAAAPPAKVEKPAPKPAAAPPAKVEKPAPAPAATPPAKVEKPAPKPAAAPAPKVEKPAPKPAAMAPPKIEKPKVDIEEGVTEEEKFEKIEFKDKFNKERALEHVKALAIPRMTGTDGEKKAASYIKEKFEKMGLKSKEEAFEFTNFNWKVLLRLIELLKTGLIVIAFVLFLLPSVAIPSIGQLIGVCISIALIGITLYSSVGARFFWKYQNSKGKILKGDQLKSSNIIAEIPCAKGKNDAAGNIIVLANYDSKSQLFSSLIRIIVFYTGIIISVLIFPFVYIGSYFLVLAGVSVNVSGLMVTLLIFAAISIGSTVLFVLNKMGNASPGAIDNATGVGVLLELAESHVKEPLESYNLTFLATGAGEQGLFGIISYLKAHESEINKEESYFINLKEIAERGHLFIPGPVGILLQLPCLDVENLYKKALKRRQIPVKEGSAKKLRVLSPWVLTSAWNDDMVPIYRGFNANRVSIGGHIRNSNVVHTKKDTIDKVDPEALDIVGKLTAEVLKRLDLRARA